ncbi:MAG: orotate phosphoribosyltransferase [Candidatus Nezhaarchaeales archaeon]
MGSAITSREWLRDKAKLAEEAALLLYEVGAILFGSFKLSSGLESPYYIDMRLVPSYPQAFDRLCDMYCRVVVEEVGGFDRVAGVPTAGVPFATLVAYKLRRPLIYVRKQQKLHGQLKMVEGLLNPGDKVLLVDDLVSTGDSALRTVRAVREAGGVVEDVVVLIDREQGARELLAEEGVELHALMKVTEAAEVLYSKGLLSRRQYEVIVDYVRGRGLAPRPSH